MFAPLAPPTIERLAANLVPVDAAAGAWLIREGERGDRFYVVDEGEVEIEIDGRTVRREGPGSSFGEIALLRDVPRTASVRAVTDVRLLALERDVVPLSGDRPRAQSLGRRGRSSRSESGSG